MYDQEGGRIHEDNLDDLIYFELDIKAIIIFLDGLHHYNSSITVNRDGERL